jgi:Zn-finger nucleic acid-binding protein
LLCPSCSVELKIADREGIEIDYCPQCRGVWLDRGELDKVVERSARGVSAARRLEPTRRDPDRGAISGRGRDHDDDDDDDHDYGRRTGKRRKGWLGDLFDFG